MLMGMVVNLIAGRRSSCSATGWSSGSCKGIAYDVAMLRSHDDEVDMLMMSLVGNKLIMKRLFGEMEVIVYEMIVWDKA
eukprot:3670530-Amphidinium_carterae.1